MTRAAREALQWERLRATLAWATERVPFYAERLRGRAVRGLGELATLPFTRKSDLREHYPFGLFAVPRAELARLHASSGTKGKPTVVGYTAGDLDIWREVMARVLVAAGGRAGDTLHNGFGYGLFTGGLGFHDGAERVGMSVVPVSSGNTARHVLLLQDLRPAGLCATPSFALHIAETLAEQGGDPRGLGLRYGLYGAEPWTEGMRGALERAFGCRAYDVYGLSEIIGPGVAGGGGARDGGRLAPGHLLPGVVGPPPRPPPPPGREGGPARAPPPQRARPLIRPRPR